MDLFYKNSVVVEYKGGLLATCSSVQKYSSAIERFDLTLILLLTGDVYYVTVTWILNMVYRPW